MKSVATFLAAMATALVLVAPAAWAEPAATMSPSEVEERLTCQCGCGLTVHTCNHLNCGFAVPVREDIAESLAAGQTGEEIIARYVDEYGEKILSSPTTEGFNLLAWIGPYIAIAIGGLLMLWTLRRWIARGPEAEEEAAAVPERAAADRSRLERELEDLDR